MLKDSLGRYWFDFEEDQPLEGETCEVIFGSSRKVDSVKICRYQKGLFRSVLSGLPLLKYPRAWTSHTHHRCKEKKCICRYKLVVIGNSVGALGILDEMNVAKAILVRSHAHNYIRKLEKYIDAEPDNDELVYMLVYYQRIYNEMMAYSRNGDWLKETAFDATV
jgi:hypothetical protein